MEGTKWYNGEKELFESLAGGNEYIFKVLHLLEDKIRAPLFADPKENLFEEKKEEKPTTPSVTPSTSSSSKPIEEKKVPKVDARYVQYLEAEYSLMVTRQYRTNAIETSIVQVPSMDEKQRDDLVTATKTTGAIQKLLDLIRSRKAEFLSNIPEDKLPRIVRTMNKLKLTPKEKQLFELIWSNSVFENRISTLPAQMIACIEMNWSEFLQFVGGSRDHMKQNFFDYFDRARPLQCSLNFTQDVIYAMLGVKLTDEQLLKIDNTAISEAIQGELTEEEIRKLKQNREDHSDKEDDEDYEGEGGFKDDTMSKEGLPKEEGVDEDAMKEDKMDEEAEDKTEVTKPTEEPEDFHDFLRRQIENEKEYQPPKPVVDKEDKDSDKLTPYSSDLDYLETECKKFLILFQIEQMERQQKESKAYNYSYSNPYDNGDIQQEVRLRELKAQARIQRKKCEKRLELTKETGSKWLPRMERMVQVRGLDDFERQLLLALMCSHISPEIQALGLRRGMPVGTALRAFCSSFEDQINHRSYFYKGSKLIKEGMIRLSGGSALDDDLMDAYITVDRRMLEFVMGLDTEFSELVEGSHLYFPKVHMENVILGEEMKKLILTTVQNFEGFKRARKRMGFDETITYGSGIVMLFFGASGTGKTMVANAIANHLNKKILLINFPSLGRMSAGENLKFIFREAKINDAILFFDECESIFESREHGGSEVNLLLTEIERHDGLIIMATNRAYDLDEAMHRRITLAIEFNKPDPILREQIWRSNIPKELRLASDVNLKDLAMTFELTGGFIKNAILSALSIAVGRDGEKDACVKQEDLESGARLQLRGRLRMIDFEHRLVPTRGLESLVLPPEKIQFLKEIINYEKARQILFGQWGFDKIVGQDKANSILFWGPPGTGKTLAAEAIAFTTGKPLKLVNTGELVSKWVGDTPKNINAVFESATANDAVLVFDEADSLFGTRTSVSTSTDRYANMDVGLLLYHIEHYKGIVILCTNLVKDIDPAFFRRIKFEMQFPLPDAPERSNLWKKLIPPECPVSKNIDYGRLGKLYEFAGGSIKSAIIRAATRAALREDPRRQIEQEDFELAGKEEQTKGAKIPQSTGQSMYT